MACIGPEQFAEDFEAVYGARLDTMSVNLEIGPAPDGTSVMIEALLVGLPRRKGAGTAAMQALCGEADRHGICVLVRPAPLVIIVDHPIPIEALQKFYENFGFVRQKDNNWQRRPKERTA